MVDLNTFPIEVEINSPINITSEISAGVTIESAVYNGARGRSAYEVWLDAGHTGSVDDYLNWLRHSTYTHNQGSADTVWIINHNLDKYPSVTIIDSADRVVIGEVFYGKLNISGYDEDTGKPIFEKDKEADPAKWITVSFAAGFSGKAYLN